MEEWNGKGNGKWNANPPEIPRGEHQDNTKIDVNSYPVYSLSQENKDE